VRVNVVCVGMMLVTSGALAAPQKPPADESPLGQFVVTGRSAEHITSLGILPSNSSAFEDVIVRNVVRRDLELSGMFRILSESKAPPGVYGFRDPVDVDAWQAAGAEVVVKVGAQSKGDNVEILGLAYFLSTGKEPVFEKRVAVEKKDARKAAHRITDALLGAITGRPGGFASQFVFSKRWGKNPRVLVMDADGHGLKPVTEVADTAIAPAWGPGHDLFYGLSRRYSPFRLFRGTGSAAKAVRLPVSGNVYGVAFDKDRKRMAVALGSVEGSAVYVGMADGGELKRVSTTPIATHPVFSPSGKVAWIGGGDRRQPQRVWVEGKPVSPSGFSAAAPTFCDTEDGIRMVYAVAVRGDKQDLVMSGERGQGVVRLTQQQGTNSYPACSSDGRLLAFFSTRRSGEGLYMMNMKRWKTTKVSGTIGESLRWAPVP